MVHSHKQQAILPWVAHSSRARQGTDHHTISMRLHIPILIALYRGSSNLIIETTSLLHQPAVGPWSSLVTVLVLGSLEKQKWSTNSIDSISQLAKSNEQWVVWKRPYCSISEKQLCLVKACQVTSECRVVAQLTAVWVWSVNGEVVLTKVDDMCERSAVRLMMDPRYIQGSMSRLTC